MNNFDITKYMFTDPDFDFAGTMSDSFGDSVHVVFDFGRSENVEFTLRKADAIALARHFELTEEDLNNE